jgi:hypothetical protein
LRLALTLALLLGASALLLGASALLLGASALPARAAQIEGQVRNATRGVLAADLPVQLVGFDSQQNTVERRTRTDARGRFRFRDLPAPGIYLVRPQGDGFSYPGEPVAFRPGEPETAPPVELSVYDLSDDPVGLRVAQVQWVVERDAGVYRVSQRARIANPGLRVVRVGAEREALLRVALAPGHGEVATQFDSLPPGVRIADGIAEIRGPVFPGDEGLVLQLSYDLGAGPEGALETRIAAPDPIDEVGLYVQDFGVAIYAGALHPARVALQDDVFFQSFIGFDVERGTALPLRVAPLPPARTASTWSAILLAALVAGSLAWFVGWPVASLRSSAAPPAPAELDPAAVALQSALADLEHDYETGKLSAEDRARLERELTRAPARADAGEPRPQQRICACGHVPAPADRFCAACGSAL